MKNRRLIFLSHSCYDKPFAESIVYWLKAHGFDDIWYDGENLGAGKIRENIGNALASAQVFVVLLSPHALQSDWVNDEIDDALTWRREGANLDIIPILVNPCRIPFRLNGYKYLDLTARKDPVSEMMQLVKLIEGQEPSTISSETTKQFAPESISQEPPKQRTSKFVINMNNAQAQTIMNYVAEHISLTENYQRKPRLEVDQDMGE